MPAKIAKSLQIWLEGSIYALLLQFLEGVISEHHDCDNLISTTKWLRRCLDLLNNRESTYLWYIPSIQVNSWITRIFVLSSSTNLSSKIHVKCVCKYLFMYWCLVVWYIPSFSQDYFLRTLDWWYGFLITVQIACSAYFFVVTAWKFIFMLISTKYEAYSTKMYQYTWGIVVFDFKDLQN